MNKLVERKAFIDSVRVKTTELKDEVLFEVSYGFLSFLDVGKDHQLSRLVERLKWRATGLKESLSFFSTSRRYSRKRQRSGYWDNGVAYNG